MMQDDIPYIPGYRRSAGGRTIILAMLTSALVSAATTVAVLRWGPPLLKRGFSDIATTEAGPAVQVPQVVSLRMNDADPLLSQLGLRMMVATRKDSDAPLDTIIEQMPLQGTQVRAGQTISVVLSAGRSTVLLPEFTGQTLAEATAALRSQGMVLGPVTEVDEGAPGMVVGQVPAVGTQLPPGSAVALQVAVQRVAVPQLLDVPIEEARKQLTDLGLAVGQVTERYDRRRRAYLVLEQQPAAQQLVPKGTEISLVINEGD